MQDAAPSYHSYRIPPEIISHAVWLCHRFCLSSRDAEDLLAQRGISVSYETIRQSCRTFGPTHARTQRRRRGRMGDTWYLDELFVTIRGRQQYLRRAVDEDGDVIDILVQSRRNRLAATGFFRKLLKGQGREPRRLITDQLRSYAAAHGAKRYNFRPTDDVLPSSCDLPRPGRLHDEAHANAKPRQHVDESIGAEQVDPSA